MYVNTFLLRPTELFNRSSYRFFFPSVVFIVQHLSSFLLLLLLSSLLSLFLTFLVSSLTRDASKWITGSSLSLSLFFFPPFFSFFLCLFLPSLFERSDRSRSSRWNAFDKALTNDARDKMHSTHRNLAHLSWFHLVEFRAWSARYKRHVNVSDNRLPPIHIAEYMGATVQVRSTIQNRSVMIPWWRGAAYLGKNWPAIDTTIDRSIPSRISFIVIFDLISRPKMENSKNITALSRSPRIYIRMHACMHDDASLSHSISFRRNGVRIGVEKEGTIRWTDTKIWKVYVPKANSSNGDNLSESSNSSPLQWLINRRSQ